MKYHGVPRKLEAAAIVQRLWFSSRSEFARYCTKLSEGVANAAIVNIDVAVDGSCTVVVFKSYNDMELPRLCALVDCRAPLDPDPDCESDFFSIVEDMRCDSVVMALREYDRDYAYTLEWDRAQREASEVPGNE